MSLDPAASYVLVGNGPSVLTGRLGAQIDAFDEVIRFNQFRVLGFEPHVGRRTTLWSDFGRGALPGDATRPPGIIMVHQNGVPAYPVEIVHRIPRKLYDECRANIRTHSRESDPKRLQNLLPTSGYVVAAWLLSLGVPVIHLAGFDHFQRHSGPFHHYWMATGKFRPKEHDGDAEARIMHELAAAGRVQYLSRPPQL